MSKTTQVNKTQHRVTSDDGRSSWLYENNQCIEVADHTEDGETYAYEYEFSYFGDQKGKLK